MKGRNEPTLIFADVQQDTPQYLCMDGYGLYVCTVAQQGGEFVEQDIQRIGTVEARIFIASAFNRAMTSVDQAITADSECNDGFEMEHSGNRRGYREKQKQKKSL